MTATPYAYAQSLVPLLVERLAPVTALGVRVAGLPDELAQTGYALGDMVLIIPVSFSPIQGQGNAVRGSATLTCTFNARIQVRQQSRLYEVADLVFQLLAGWEIVGGMVLTYNGSELVPGAQNDPAWISDMQWAVTYQVKPGKG